MNRTTGNMTELVTQGGSNSISVTPGTSIQTATFGITNVEPFVPTAQGDPRRNYVARFHTNLQMEFDPDAAGSAVSWDKLHKGLSSLEVTAPLQGTWFQQDQTRGVVLGHLIQVIGCGYTYPQAARTQIPTNTDSDVTLQMFYVAPMVHEGMARPEDTAQWAGFFDGGKFEGRVAASNVYDGDYAGAVIKATTALRGLVETFPMKYDQIGLPFQYRERIVSGGGPAPTLQGVGADTALNGISPGCGLAGVWWLTNATGIGLSGPDGVDNFTSINIPWRQQKNIQNLDGYFLQGRIMRPRRVGPVAGTGTTIIGDGSGWPNPMDTATQQDGRPAANAQAMFLEIVAPGWLLKTSHVQRVFGNLPFQFGVTAAITSDHRFVTFELLEWSPQQLQTMAAAARMTGVGTRLGLNGQSTDTRYAPTVY